MTTPTFTAEETSLAALAGELRITLGKLVRRLREQTPANDFTSAQKSVLLRLDRDGTATVSALARARKRASAVHAQHGSGAAGDGGRSMALPILLTADKRLSP